MNFTDISCFLNKLKIKQKLLEKNGCDFLKSISENYGIVLDEENVLVNARNEQQLLTLKKDVLENHKILQELKDIVSPENIPKIDLLALKHKMLTLENSIQNIKDSISNNMEILQKEENELYIDVTNLEIKYCDLNKIKSETVKVPVSYTNRKKESTCLYQEVEDFANFVNQNGGHEGGWSQNDHLVFLRYYHQIKSQKSLIKVLCRFLPDFPETKITSHIDWYEEYIFLREKQKKALDEWRRNKLATNRGQGDTNENLEKPATPEEKKKLIETERQIIKEKISQWKLEKQQKQKQTFENRLKIESNFEKNSKQKKKCEREMKIEQKNDIGKWRASKQAQKRAEQMEQEVKALKEKERKIVIANALIREFQKQDSLYLMRRINKYNLKTDEILHAPHRRHLMNNKYRDPERIFKATSQWLARISCENNKIPSMFDKKPLNVQQIPKLGVPTWRLIAK